MKQTLSSKNGYCLNFLFEENTWNQFSESVYEVMTFSHLLGTLVLPSPHTSISSCEHIKLTKTEGNSSKQNKTKSTWFSPTLSVMWSTVSQRSYDENKKASSMSKVWARSLMEHSNVICRLIISVEIIWFSCFSFVVMQDILSVKLIG